jgi:hypothetical protein
MPPKHATNMLKRMAWSDLLKLPERSAGVNGVVTLSWFTDDKGNGWDLWYDPSGGWYRVKTL